MIPRGDYTGRLLRCTPRLRQIGLRLHLDQAARRAIELEHHRAEPRVGRVLLDPEQLLRWRVGRDDELDAVVVEHVDHQGEAARLLGELQAHARHARDDHRVEALGQVQVIVLRAPPAADYREIEPGHAARAVQVGDHAPLDVELLELLLDLGDAAEGLHERAVGLLAQGRVVDLDALEHPLAVIDPTVDVQHVQPRLQDRYRRQEVLALEAVLVQIVGAVVRGEAAHHAEVHDAAEQPPDDHRVGDVVHVHLVEADQAIPLGDALGERGERVFPALQFLELAVHVAHEVVEVHAALAYERQAQVEAVHEEALAAAHAAPEVDAARQLGVHDQAPQRRRAPRLVGRPLLVKLLQALDRTHLRGVALEAAPLQGAVVDLDRPALDDLLAFSRFQDPFPHQMFSARLSTARAASFIASDSEGCAWQIMPMSSLEARNSIATTASAINSDANAPMMCTPRMVSVFASARYFTRPLVSPTRRP